MISRKITSNEAGQRFDKYLKKLLKDAPDSFLYKMLRKKNIVLNGKRSDGREVLCIDDEVKFFLSDDTFEKFQGKTVDRFGRDDQIGQSYQKLKKLQIIYENEHILVVNKPAGILSQKATPDDVSINEWFIGYLLSQHVIKPDSLLTFKPSICNRLDRNTSGMVVCGKTLAGTQYLTRIIKEKTLEKYYYCLVSGTITIQERLTGYLYKNMAQNKVTIYQNKVEIPDFLVKDAVFIDTAFQSKYSANNITLLEIQLFTGKTHQIRAHLAALGCPIIGDTKYGNPTINKIYEKKGVKNQMLHAHKLIFPTTSDQTFSDTSGKILECPMPSIFEKILNS